MAQTKIKAGLFEGIIGNGTDGYFLMSNGDGTMAWSSIIINPTITSLAYPGSVSAADPAGGETITLTGTGFKTGATVTIGGTAAPAVSYVSGTQITFTTPAKAAGDYDIVVTNADTGSATYINGISYNGIPSWTTAAGSLGTFASGATISTITLQATEPDAGTITFNITNGALPTGLLLTGANIDGTTSLETADTLYTFTITATDDESQATPRTFTITVKKEFKSVENFTINTYAGSGATQSIEGKIGTAAQFDGSGYINLGNSPAFSSTTTGELTISFWINTTDSDGGYVLSKADDTQGKYEYDLYVQTDGTLTARAINSSAGIAASVSTTATVNNGAWHHVVFTIDDGTSVSVSVDNGSPVTSTGWSGTVIYQSAALFMLGTLHPASASAIRFSGKLDQVRVFDKVLSSSEITTLYGENNTSSTKSTTDIFSDGSGVALYEFEKGAKDTGGVSGYIGNSSAVFVNPTGSKIGHSISVGADFSVSFWINISSYANTYYQNTTGDIIGFGADSGNGIWISTYNGKFSLLRGSTIGGQAISTNTNVPVNTWAHVVISYSNGNTTSFYVNGSAAGTYSHTTTTTNTGVGILSYIGDSDYPTKSVKSSFTGKIDQVRIFNKAISSSEVTTLYGETTASATKSTTDIFGDSSGVALYELEGNANDTGGTYNGTPTNVSYAYDGTPTNVSFVGTSFQPDLVWMKDRDTTNYEHVIFDSVRGTGTSHILSSDLTSQEGWSTSGSLTSFDSNGFTLPNTVLSNANGHNYVAWCWKAGGAASLNENGSIDSQVSANQDAGFSIVTFNKTTNASTASTFGHGLSAAPEMIVLKRTDGAEDWYVYHTSLGNAARVQLNSSAAQTTGTNVWGQTDPTATVFTVESFNAGNAIAYCFHSVDGYQKIGSYTGVTGNKTVTTGFRPRFLLIKNTSLAGNNWNIMDSTRDANNPIELNLWADTSDSEATASQNGIYDVDFNDDGFTIKNNYYPFNFNGESYIYLAIA